MRITTLLTKSIVENAVIEAGIPLLIKKLEIKEAALAEKIRSRLVPLEAEKQMNKIQQDLSLLSQSYDGLVRMVPFIKSHLLNIRLPADYIELHFSKVMGAQYVRTQHASETDLTKTERRRLDGILSERESINKSRIEIRSLVKDRCSSVRTVKQLIDSWPESEKLIPKVNAKKQQLIVNNDTLNTLIFKSAKKKLPTASIPAK